MWVLRREDFFKAFRMTPELFDRLLHGVTPLIKKQTTRLRRPISPGEKLAVTLRCVTITLDWYEELTCISYLNLPFLISTVRHRAIVEIACILLCGLRFKVG